MPSRQIFVGIGAGAAALLLAASLPLASQGPGPVPVGFTEAREIDLERSVQLTGSVEARRSSIVASEIAGLVTELSVREGSAVGRGAPLARLRLQNLELTRVAKTAERTEALARLELATANLERARELFAAEVISRERLDDATAEYAAWQGRSERLEAEIARVEDDLARSVIRAPFSGVVVEEHTQVGEWLGVGSPVVELVDLGTLEVALEVPERYFAGLARGTPARVSFEALPGLELAGEIAAVIPRADPQTRTFPVKVRFTDRERRVGTGMLAQVSLPVGSSTPAVVVPKDALVRSGERAYVFRLDGDNAAERVEITPGAAAGAWVEVAGGIAAGERVVTRGNERLRPGQAVTARPIAYEPP